MVTLPDGLDSNRKQQWRTEFTNRSNDPLYEIEIHGFLAHVEDDADAVNMRAFAETSLSEEPIRTGGWRKQVVLEAGGRFDIRWEADDADELNPAPAFAVVWYSVMDAKAATGTSSTTTNPRRFLARPVVSGDTSRGSQPQPRKRTSTVPVSCVVCGRLRHHPR